MSLLEPHLVSNQPDWTGQLVLSYKVASEWLDDLYLVRARLGWPLKVSWLPLVSTVEAVAEAVAESPSGDYSLMLEVNFTTLRLGADHFPVRQVIDLLLKDGGAKTLTEVLMQIPTKALPGPQSVYECILSEDFL